MGLNGASLGSNSALSRVTRSVGPNFLSQVLPDSIELEGSGQLRASNTKSESTSSSGTLICSVVISFISYAWQGYTSPPLELRRNTLKGTDISKITRKPSKTGKHGHEERKSTKEARDAKPKAGKVKKSKLWSTLGQFSVNKSQP
ncbi:hypothetical protein Tco_0888202 [Tanacetum coccineum]